jgi:hypothetical protein
MLLEPQYTLILYCPSLCLELPYDQCMPLVPGYSRALPSAPMSRAFLAQPNRRLPHFTASQPLFSTRLSSPQPTPHVTANLLLFLRFAL